MLSKPRNITEFSVSANTPRVVLSLREAIVLANVPEKRVRKDIETGLLTAPQIIRANDTRLSVGYGWSSVIVFAAVYGNELLPGGLRKRAFEQIDALESNSSVFLGAIDLTNDWQRAKWRNEIEQTTVTLDKYLTLSLSKVMEDVEPRIILYARGLEKIDNFSDVLSGDTVFKGTRLSVCHVGKMYGRGEPMETILEDYDYLEEDDVLFAQLYYRANPPVGRPRTGVGVKDASRPIG